MFAMHKTFSISPAGFLTTYDAKLGVELFESKDRCWLKLLAKLLNVYLFNVLSLRCFHQWGGTKMMLREVHAWINQESLLISAALKPCSKGYFIYKTDIYSYYASINHEILIQQIKGIGWPSAF